MKIEKLEPETLFIDNKISNGYINPPDNWKIMEKINEIIDYINKINNNSHEYRRNFKHTKNGNRPR